MEKETYYEPAQCEQIRFDCKEIGCDADPRFWRVSAGELSLIMNGCGPDSWVDSMRCLASWVYRNYREAIAIHDFDFQHSDGNLNTLKKVNQRFLDNGKKKLDRMYPISWRKAYLMPIRGYAWSKLQVAYVALKNGSEEAWISAYNRYGKTQQEQESLV